MDQIMQLGGVGIGGTIVIGLLAGWLAEKITGSDHGLIRNLFFGLVGSWLGFFVANLAGIQLTEVFHGWFWGNLLVSAAGAVILLMITKTVFGGKRRT
jgi:uncharacterized membrane protein YeaQ/YmgE (transglycosylase-associated protein family)